MPMYLCSWPDRSTMLLERADEKDAKRDATSAADGEVPTRTRRFLPNVFIAEVAFDVEEGDEATVDDLVVEVLPHIAELLFDLEPSDVDVDVTAETERPGPAALVQARASCVAEASDDEGRVIRCARAHGHNGEHEDSTGGLVWK